MAQAHKCRIVFMGTPDFAAASLQALADWPGGELAAVYTQPDRPAGRGHKLAMSAVKHLALDLGLPVLQPSSLKTAQAQAQLAAFRPDVLAVAAYGLILPDAVLAMPRLAPVNVHASLLPKWRGAAPIQRAIMDGWQPGAQTGVSIMRISSRLDAGPVYAVDRVEIGQHTAGSLHPVLAHMGAKLLVRVLARLGEGGMQPQEQDEAQASYAPKIRKEDGQIDWNRPAAQVHAHIRGVTPWPGARALLAPHTAPPVSLILAPGSVGAPIEGHRPGDLWHDAEGLRIACADRWYALSTVRPQGRKDMAVKDFVNGSLRGLPQGCCGRAAAFSG